jgi:hypothetical protein
VAPERPGELVEEGGVVLDDRDATARRHDGSSTRGSATRTIVPFPGTLETRMLPP